MGAAKVSHCREAIQEAKVKINSDRMKHQSEYDYLWDEGDEWVKRALLCYSDEDFDAEVEEYEDIDEFLSDLRIEGMIPPKDV